MRAENITGEIKWKNIKAAPVRVTLKNKIYIIVDSNEFHLKNVDVLMEIVMSKSTVSFQKIYVV